MTQSNIPADQRFQSGDLDVAYRFRASKGETARPTVEVNLPVPTAQEISNLLTAQLEDGSKLGKVRETVMEAIYGLVIGAGKLKVDADLEFDQDSVAGILDDISLYTIANLPRAERNMVTNSDLSDFAQVYRDKAAEILGISQKAADSLAYHMSNHKAFRTVVAQAGMPEAIQGRLEGFVAGLDDETLGEHAATVEWLNTRIEDTLKINIDPNDI